MKVSSRAHYGLRIMTELARAHGQGTISLSEIARHEKLPQGYLEQLVAPLRKAGLVQATRGAHGGYRLARDPAEITVGVVVRALEGPIAPVECAADDYNPGGCDMEGECASRPLWLRVRDSINQVLDSTTLADLCRRPANAVTFLPDFEPGATGRDGAATVVDFSGKVGCTKEP